MKLRSDRLKQLAAQKGFGRIEDMAREFGLSRPHLSQLLNHKYLPSLPTAQRMAQKLDIAVEDLYDTGGE